MSEQDRTDCVDLNHFWPEDYQEGDTCNCGAFYAIRANLGGLQIQESGATGPAGVSPQAEQVRIDLDRLAKGVRMLGFLPHEHPQAAVYNEALALAANYLRGFIGREEYLPKASGVSPHPEPQE
jgi:hypothetical protein